MAQNPTVAAASAAADRISDLPSHVVDNILKHLPLQVAVRTSILSRGWRYKWTTIPHLVFDEHFIISLGGNYEPKSIINHVLAVHKGPIVSFELFDFYIEDVSTIDSWLHFLSNHRIEDLVLQMSHYNGREVVPHHLFAFVHLRYLCLWLAEVRLPPVFNGFTRLVKLFLMFVDFEFEDGFNMFISKCPMLEHLQVSECHTPLSLVVNAPNLKIFRFEGKFKSIIFKNVNIEDFSVLGVDFDDTMLVPESLGNESNLIKVFGQLLSMRRLSFDDHFLQFLAVGGVPHKLPYNFNHLTALEFLYVNFGNMDHVTCVLCLIRSSPNLQTLEIECDTTNHLTAFDVIQHLKAQQKLEIPLSCCLKNVTITSFAGFKTEMQFVKLLLLGAVVLRELKLPTNDPRENGYEMFKKLLRFSRASPKAVIIVD